MYEFDQDNMDFLLRYSGVVKALAEDGEVTVDMLLPPDKKDAVADFVKHIEILESLSNEPNIGVKRILDGLCPYVCLDGLSNQTHENLLFLIDYFDLPDKLAKRVYLSMTRDIEATFPDVLEAKAFELWGEYEEKYYRDILFWIAVREEGEINRELQCTDGYSNNRFGVAIKLCGKTKNKECFDLIMSNPHKRLPIDLWRNCGSQVLTWLCQDNSYPRRESFETIVLHYIQAKDLECVKILFNANIIWRESFNCQRLLTQAICAPSIEIVEYLYLITRPELDTYMYELASDKYNIFVWLCEKQKPTMDISRIKQRVLYGYVLENIKYFHENIQPIREEDVHTCFLETETDCGVNREITKKLHQVFKYYNSLDINILLPDVCRIAIAWDSPKTLHLLHKLGYKFKMDDLLATLDSPDGYYWHTEAFLVIHKYLNYCNFTKEMKARFLWNCSFNPNTDSKDHEGWFDYNQKLKYIARTQKYRNRLKKYSSGFTK